MPQLWSGKSNDVVSLAELFETSEAELRDQNRQELFTVIKTCSKILNSEFRKRPTYLNRSRAYFSNLVRFVDTSCPLLLLLLLLLFAVVFVCILLSFVVAIFLLQYFWFVVVVFVVVGAYRWPCRCCSFSSCWSCVFSSRVFLFWYFLCLLLSFFILRLSSCRSFQAFSFFLCPHHCLFLFYFPADNTIGRTRDLFR